MDTKDQKIYKKYYVEVMWLKIKMLTKIEFQFVDKIGGAHTVPV